MSTFWWSAKKDNQSYVHNSALTPIPSTIFFHIQLSSGVDDDEQQGGPYRRPFRRMIQQKLQLILQHQRTFQSIRYNIAFANDVAQENADSAVNDLISAACPDCIRIVSNHSYSTRSGQQQQQHTLQYLWEYCLNHPSEYVTYLHTNDPTSDLPVHHVDCLSKHVLPIDTKPISGLHPVDT
jgi:hypothetical protein